MSRIQTDRVESRVDPSTLLPAGWNLEFDVLLVVGEDAGFIAERFVLHGLHRVIAVFPEGVPVQPTASSVTAVTTWQTLTNTVLLFPGSRARRCVEQAR